MTATPAQSKAQKSAADGATPAQAFDRLPEQFNLTAPEATATLEETLTGTNSKATERRALRNSSADSVGAASRAAMQPSETTERVVNGKIKPQSADSSTAVATPTLMTGAARQGQHPPQAAVASSPTAGRANREKRTPSPQVRIGQVNVIVEGPRENRKSRPEKPVHDNSSRLFLRGL